MARKEYLAEGRAIAEAAKREVDAKWAEFAAFAEQRAKAAQYAVNVSAARNGVKQPNDDLIVRWANGKTYSPVSIWMRT